MNGRARKINGFVAAAVVILVLAGVLVLSTVGSRGAANTLQEEAGTSPAATAAADGSEPQYAEGVVDIALGDVTVVSGAGATVEGRVVTITAAGVYHVSGTLSDGCLEVDAQGKVYLEFDGVEISSSYGPALCITDAKKVTLTLAAGTTNYLADAPSDVEEDAALFTNDTLVINGSGTLVVFGNNNEGISSDDDLIINSGVIEVTAVDDGLNAHDDVTVNDGEIHIMAGGDGVDSNGTVNINGGTLLSFGGIDEGDGGIDAVGDLVIRGGVIIASGNTSTAPCADSKQCSILVAAGTEGSTEGAIVVRRDGEEILTVVPEIEYRTALISSGKLIAGADYEVYVGGTQTALRVSASN